jgi:putative thioredoxin
MNAANYIVDIDESNAQTLLIEESQKRPVIVDFWADWCAPCKQLMPILEKLAAEYQGAFLLAKVNADEQQMLAQQLGVRSLPTVMVIKDGQPVDGFSGAQPESAVRDMLDKHVPSPQADSLVEAEQLLAEGDIPGALALFRGAWEDSGQKPEFTMAYAGALITASRLDEAEALLSDIKMVDQDARYQQLMAQIELQRQAARS